MNTDIIMVNLFFHFSTGSNFSIKKLKKNFNIIFSVKKTARLYKNILRYIELLYSPLLQREAI